jgi:hypothetical protein
MPDKFELDFREIEGHYSHRRGYAFQSLIADIGQKLGYKVTEGGIGPDRGRDLFFEITNSYVFDKQQTTKWLVSCKDNSQASRAVTRSDIIGGYEDAQGHNCDGYLLACTTAPNDDVVTMLSGWESAKAPLLTHIWNGNKIQRNLQEREEDFRFALVRYFPKSYGHTSKFSDKLLSSIIELLSTVETTLAVERITSISEELADPLSVLRLAEFLVYEKIPTLEQLYSLLHIWCKISDLDFGTGLSDLLCDHLELTLQHEADKRLRESLDDNEPWSVQCSIVDVRASIGSENVVLLTCAGEAEIENLRTGVTYFTGASFVLKIAELCYEFIEVEVDDFLPESYEE